jgi:hypothetical protein
MLLGRTAEGNKENVKKFLTIEEAALLLAKREKISLAEAREKMIAETAARWAEGRRIVEKMNKERSSQ